MRPALPTSCLATALPDLPPVSPPPCPTCPLSRRRPALPASCPTCPPSRRRPAPAPTVRCQAQGACLGLLLGVLDMHRLSNRVGGPASVGKRTVRRRAASWVARMLRGSARSRRPQQHPCDRKAAQPAYHGCTHPAPPTTPDPEPSSACRLVCRMGPLSALDTGCGRVERRAAGGDGRVRDQEMLATRTRSRHSCALVRPSIY